MPDSITVEEPTLVACDACSEWNAWVNLMPPSPNDFHVVGDVLVPNPGVIALLTPKVPQGINPSILLMDLCLVQRPGVWPRVETCIQARYDKVVFGSPYRRVQVFVDNAPVAEMDVQEVH